MSAINTRVSDKISTPMGELFFQRNQTNKNNSIEKATEILKKQPSLNPQNQFEQVMNMPSIKKNVVTKAVSITKMQSMGEKQLKISRNNEIQPIQKTKDTVSSVVNKRKREDSILPEAIEAAKRICSDQKKELKSKNRENVIVKTNAVKTKMFWTSSDDQKLLNGYETYGTQWSRISEEFLKGKYNQNACMIRYNRVLHPSLKWGKWSEEERKLLLEGMKIHGESWVKIARDLFKWTRSDEECKKEYRRVLDPNLQHGRWTKEEEKKFLELKSQGYSFAYCGNALQRPDDRCLKKYASLQGKI